MRPRNGRSVRPGMYRCGAGVIFSPTKPAPIRPERPMPRMVSARPAATWLTASPSVNNANTAESAAPAAIPHSAPRKVEPVSQTPAKPQAAPMIIMPSTPRLSTPERSTTSSPAAASSSGVEAAITDRMMASSSPIRGLSIEFDEADAIEDQGIAGEDIEQQDALEHLGEIERDLHRYLRALAADERQRKKQSRHQDADWIKSAEERDDDRGEAVARRNTGLQMADGPGDLDDAGKARERAGHREGEQDELVGVEAG